MRNRPWLGRVLLVLISTLLTAVAVDLWLRTRVADCEKTPFRTTTLKGLPHELFPGRTTTYKGVLVRINELGLRGPPLPPPVPGRERLAVIGDSVTFGNGCTEEETIAASIARELASRDRDVEAINCGVPAYNADNVALMLRERILPLRPARVLYVMVANDVANAQRAREIPVDAEIDKCADFPLASPFLQLLSQRATGVMRMIGIPHRGYVESILGQFERVGRERLERALTEMQRLCREASIPFGVAVYPYMVPIAANPFRPIEDECVQRCAALSIPCVRISDAFVDDENLARFWVGMFDAHPNGESNAIAARRIVQQLFSE